MVNFCSPGTLSIYSFSRYNLVIPGKEVDSVTGDLFVSYDTWHQVL